MMGRGECSKKFKKLKDRPPPQIFMHSDFLESRGKIIR